MHSLPDYVCHDLAVTHFCGIEPVECVTLIFRRHILRLISAPDTWLENTQHINAFGFDICYLTEHPGSIIGVYICMVSQLLQYSHPGL